MDPEIHFGTAFIVQMQDFNPSGTMSSAQLDQLTVHPGLFSFPAAFQADQEQVALHLPTCIMNTLWEAARQVQWVRSFRGAGALVQSEQKGLASL